MNDLEFLQKKQQQVLIIVCMNFTLFMLLFVGLGYVTWQSATLVHRLQKDLDRAETTIANLQSRFENIEIDDIIDKLVSKATVHLESSIQQVVLNSDLVTPIQKASEKVAITQEMIKETGESIKEIQETISQVDTQQISDQVSYNILKGIGEGFQEAAEARNPKAQPAE